MRTLWQQLLDFIESSGAFLRDIFAASGEQAAGEKEKRKHPLNNQMEHFTQRSRRVLGWAQIAAEHLEQSWIGPEHVLLGLIREVNGMAGSVLRELKIDLAQAEALVSALPHLEKRKPGETSPIQLSTETKKLLELSVVEARRLEHRSIGTEHLLLGLLNQPESHAIEVLHQLGVTPEILRIRVLVDIDERQDEE